MVLGLPKKPNKYYRPNGSFYGGYLFSFNPKKKFTDFLYNISHNFYNHEIKSNLSIYTEIKKLPTNEDEIIKELVLEKIKITYIREIKILRSKACIYSMIIWMFFGCAIWLASLMQPHKSSPPKENEKICINFTIKNIEEPITKPTTPLKYFSHDNKKNVDCDKLIPYSSMKSSESFNLNNLVGLP